ncbi:MAG: hypothetical protein WCG78_00470 [Candidatus Omnitrophota bacterium]
MRRSKAMLTGFLGVVLIGALTQVSAAAVGSEKRVIHVPGVIAGVDVKAGTLRLEADASRDARDPLAYRINKDATRVTDPTDKKFLKLEDLQVGQRVAVEFDYIDGVWKETPPIAQKIIADPIPEPVYEEITGALVAIDAQAGTFTIEQRPLPGNGGSGALFSFIFEPREIIVMKAPSLQPVQLELKPGDLLQVECVGKDGKRYARFITLLSGMPEAGSTITTTTTSTTVTQ